MSQFHKVIVFVSGIVLFGVTTASAIDEEQQAKFRGILTRVEDRISEIEDQIAELRKGMPLASNKLSDANNELKRALATRDRVLDMIAEFEKRPLIKPVQFRPNENVHARLDRTQMEDLLYGTLGGSKQAFRRQKRDSIYRYVDQIDKICDLSEEQRAKVEQSIDIEIARIESKVTSLLVEIDEKTEPSQKQRIFGQAWTQAQELQNEFKDPNHSLWHKTMQTVLLPDQVKLLEEDREKIAGRQRQVKHLRLILVAQRKLGLNLDQRKALSVILAKPEYAGVETLLDLQEKLQDGERAALNLSEDQIAKLKLTEPSKQLVPILTPFNQK